MLYKICSGITHVLNIVFVILLFLFLQTDNERYAIQLALVAIVGLPVTLTCLAIEIKPWIKKKKK